VTDQPDFLNAVLVADDPELDAWGLAAPGAGTRGRLGPGPRAAVGAAHPRRRRRPGDRRRRPRSPRTTRSCSCRTRAPPTGPPVLLPWLLAEPGAVLHGHGPVADLLDRLGPDGRAGVHRRDDVGPAGPGMTAPGPGGRRLGPRPGRRPAPDRAPDPGSRRRRDRRGRGPARQHSRPADLRVAADAAGRRGGRRHGPRRRRGRGGVVLRRRIERRNGAVPVPTARREARGGAARQGPPRSAARWSPGCGWPC
jgi:2-amino-4-hydroxy-6-hydroxymethyldihydropteridine diphosphokinase